MTQRRRARLRAETTAEITAIALKQMETAGPAAVSLRAIARDMGMTAGAIYSYFNDRDDLISTLVADIYSKLADALEIARDSHPESDPVGRVLAVGHAYRQWAITHPQEFRLVYGDPIPGYQASEEGAAAEAEHRACAVLLSLVRTAWPIEESHPHQNEAPAHPQWSDFKPGFMAIARNSFPELPPEAIALSLRIWCRMHGPIALEIYGHLSSQIHDPADIYHAELLDITRTLGLAPKIEI